MRYIFLTINLFLFGLIYPQLSLNSAPKSLLNSLDQNIPIIEMPLLDIDEILNMDEPSQFGYSFSVDFDFFEHANMIVLDNGDKIFRLILYSSEKPLLFV